MILSRIKYRLARRSFFKHYRSFVKGRPSYDKFMRTLDQDRKGQAKCLFVEVYDILSNGDFNKLVVKLYHLKRKPKKYRINIYLRKKTLSDLRYVEMQINYTRTTLLATINLLDDKYLAEMTIGYTQINNSEIIVEYKFRFKSPVHTYAQIHQMVFDNIDIIESRRNSTVYMDDIFERSKSDKEGSYKQIITLEDTWLREWIQSYIDKMLYSKLGRIYTLPVIYNYTIKDRLEDTMDDLKNPFLCSCYSNNNESEFIHISYIHDIEVCRYVFGANYTESNFLDYFSKFGNEFYFQIFSQIENKEIERRLGKYLISQKRKVSLVDHKWVINKIRALKEKEVFERNIGKDQGWYEYQDGVRTEKKLIDYPTHRNKYLGLYEKYLDYINSINNVSYSIDIYWITIITLALTVLGLIIAVAK